MVNNLQPWRSPFLKLMAAIVLGLVTTGLALAWPVVAQSVSPPDIIQVKVVSSQAAFFYSPPLGQTGGTVYFNSRAGEGAGQIITVTVTVSDNNPTTFSGGLAFGITPTTNISTPYVTTSTWSLTYIIQALAGSENGVVFTITDLNNLTDTLILTFTQDNTRPVISSPAVSENSGYLHAVGNTGLYYGNNMTSAVPFTVTGQAADNGVGLDRATFSTAFGDTPPPDGIPSVWMALYTVESTHTVNGQITVNVYDRVSNVATQTFVYTRDIAGPAIPLNFAHIPDLDSGNDGFAPDTNGNYEDDPDINVSWSASADTGSGLAGYRLDTQSPPTSSPLLAGTTGTVSVGNDNDYPLYVMAVDNVGNPSPVNSLGDPVRVRRAAPSGGRLSLTEVSGGQYLYIQPSTLITAGTLFYNNAASSSFRVAADTTSPPFSWGTGVFGWKVVFSPGWGETGMNQIFFPSSQYTHTYNIAPLETTDVFTVYYVNRAGNVLALPIQAERDTSGPSITFTSVTTPDWTAAGVYWYRKSKLGDWAFATDVIGEQVGVAPNVGWAYWDHSVGSLNDQSRSAPGGDGVFNGVGGNPDGMVTVTVVLTDRVNNSGSIARILNLDGTPPVITPTGWIESSPYLHVVGNRLFFSQVISDNRSATLSGFAADPGGGSGLNRAVFSPEPNLAGSPGDDNDPGSWQGSYTFASNSSQGDGLADVTVYDRVGNPVAAAFTYTLDSSAPNGALLNVTNPGYDPDGIELNDTGNWYRSSNLSDGPGSDGWNFFFDFADAGAGMRSVRADWNHSVDAYDQLNYNPGLDGQGVFGTQGGSSGAAVNDDADGVVTVTLGLEDNVGNWGYDSLILRIDNTPPLITGGSWAESSEYLHAAGSTLYFSHQMSALQSAALSGQASDGSGSGLGVMTFSPEPGLAGSPGPDGAPADWSGTYAFNNISQGDGTVVVTLTDRLAHFATQSYTYVLDTIPPTSPGAVTINTPPVVGNYYNTRSLDLSWLASTDNITGSGLLGYFLGTSNPPAEPYSPPATGALFDVGSDGTFTLYLAARDRVRNSTVAGSGPITIDTLGPVSFITASPEEVNRRFLVAWGADDATTWPVAFEVEYQVDDGAWIPWLTAAGAASQYFGPSTPVEVSPDSAYEFRVRARDYVNNQGGWAESGKRIITRRFIYLPLAFRAYDASIPFAVFDGFETGTLAGWKAGGALPASIVTSPLPPGGGTYAALLGSPAYGCGDSATVPIGQASIQAYAYVPGGGTPYLRFSYRVRSYDTVRNSPGEWWDRLEVRVNDVVLARYGDPDPGNLNCGNLYDTDWQQAEFNLSGYKNSTVLLTFFNENHSDPFWNTYSYLDNIRIEVGP